MDKCEKKPRKLQNSCPHQVVVGAQKITELEVTDMIMTEAEEDIICRMHKLVGDNWELIAGRIPGRKAEEIKRFWLKNNSSNNNNRDRFSN